MSQNYFFLFLLSIGTFACISNNSSDQLPIIGESEMVNGERVYHTIPDFNFINQDSQKVDNGSFENKAYVVDFFFISCPTICPKLTKQMLRIHDRFETNERLLLLSHSIDTRYDTIPRLRKYAENLGVDASKWHFVTGEKDDIHDIAKSYFSLAYDDDDAPGGYEHTGYLVLVDGDRHVRAFCDGTDPKDVDEFMDDIDKLLLEMGE